jgi:hypothetical protein
MHARVCVRPPPGALTAVPLASSALRSPLSISSALASTPLRRAPLFDSRLSASTVAAPPSVPSGY